jgi:hypothetical protein
MLSFVPLVVPVLAPFVLSLSMMAVSFMVIVVRPLPSFVFAHLVAGDKGDGCD